MFALFIYILFVVRDDNLQKIPTMSRLKPHTMGMDTCMYLLEKLSGYEYRYEYFNTHPTMQPHIIYIYIVINKFLNIILS
jgi:hypothetical protein